MENFVTRVDKVLNIVKGNSNERLAKFYKPNLKAVFQKNQFSTFLRGNWDKVTPVCVEIVPVVGCNSDCTFGYDEIGNPIRCTYRQGATNNIGRMKLDDGKRIINSLVNAGIKSVIYTGGWGEPTLNKELPEIMCYSKEHNLDMGLYTNGQIWNKEYIKRILDSQPTFVRISLNAGTAETHEKVFHSSARLKKGYNHQKYRKIFDDTVDHAIFLGKEKLTRSSNTTVGLGVVINSINSHELREMTELAVKIWRCSEGGVEYLALRPAVQYFSDKEVQKKQPNKELHVRMLKEITNTMRPVIDDSKLELIINNDFFYELTQEYKNEPDISSLWCCSVDVDGSIYITSETNETRGYDLGNLLDQSFEEIWNGEKHLNLLQKAYNRDILSLHVHKLKSLNRMLLEIQKSGTLPFTENDINEFYEKISKNFIVPKHVNFI